LQQVTWVGEIGQGFTTVTVVGQQPPVKHKVRMKDFVSWVGRQGRSPAEVMLKQKLERIFGQSKPRVNQQEDSSDLSDSESEPVLGSA